MRADLTKVRQALFNLLRNACKFTEHGHRLARGARGRPAPAATGSIFGVSDTGIGMTPEQIGAAVPGVHPGRRLDDAALRRHRPRPGDQPALLPDDGRRHHGGERAGPRAARSPSACPAEVRGVARASRGAAPSTSGAGDAARAPVLVIDDDPASAT